jgi:branched-subunit amino acid aminotransferase/4-amino-4-deoxychorismate lyase
MSVPTGSVVLLNGRMVAAHRAQVSVFDRGLMYGDGLLETLRAYRGRPFALEAHLRRLRASADFLGLAVPRRPWHRDVAALLRRNHLLHTDAWVRITLTRGVNARGVSARGLMPPARSRPTLIIMAGALDTSVSRAQCHGVRVALLPFARHGFLAEHKVLNYLPGVLGRVMAARHDAFEGLFVDADGMITEGTTSNLFAWRGRQLLTPPIQGILPGLTRRLVIELAASDGVRVVEQPVRAEDLVDANEAFLTNSLVEVVPIIRVNARTIGSGAVGPRTLRLQQLYRQTVDQALARQRRQ